MPGPPIAASLPKTATKDQQRDVYEAVLRGFVDLLQAWGASASENLAVCSAQHRAVAGGAR